MAPKLLNIPRTAEYYLQGKCAAAVIACLNGRAVLSCAAPEIVPEYVLAPHTNASKPCLYGCTGSSCTTPVLLLGLHRTCWPRPCLYGCSILSCTTPVVVAISHRTFAAEPCLYGCTVVEKGQFCLKSSFVIVSSCMAPVGVATSVLTKK